MKCGIQYNIIAGTLLARFATAALFRDDDADVAMPGRNMRSSWKACKNELDTTRFYFQDHRNTQGIPLGVWNRAEKHSVSPGKPGAYAMVAAGVFIDIFSGWGTG